MVVGAGGMGVHRVEGMAGVFAGNADAYMRWRPIDLFS